MGSTPGAGQGVEERSVMESRDWTDDPPHPILTKSQCRLATLGVPAGAMPRSMLDTSGDWRVE